VAGIDKSKLPEARSNPVIPEAAARLLDTRRAFDSVAGESVHPLDSNALLQVIRASMWRRITAAVPAGPASWTRVWHRYRCRVSGTTRLSGSGRRLVTSDGGTHAPARCRRRAEFPHLCRKSACTNSTDAG